MKSHELSERLWQKIAIDLLELERQNYAVIVDYYSKFFELSHLPNSKSKIVISHIKPQLARYGIPEVIVSDNGLEFDSAEFKEQIQSQSQTRVLGEIVGAGFIDEVRMADGIHSVLIDPEVEGSVVQIPDFLADSNLVVKVGGICASSKEGVVRIHGFDDRKGFDELSHARIRFL